MRHFRSSGVWMQGLAVLVAMATFSFPLNPFGQAMRERDEAARQMQAAGVLAMARQHARSLPRPAPPPLAFGPSAEEIFGQLKTGAAPAPGQIVVAGGARMPDEAKRQLARLDVATRAEFDSVHRHLVEVHAAREMFERERRAVQNYEGHMADLLARLDRIERLRGPARSREIDAALQEVRGARTSYALRHFNPNHLPIRLAKARADLTLSASVTALGSPATIADPAPTDADLAETEDVQITQEVKDLASSLGNNPVRILNWVHDHVEFVPTHGSMKGSALTLLEKRGNAFDTSSLLIALLRSAGIPARYVFGTVEIPAEKVQNWLGGASTPEAAQELLGSGGIPNVAIVRNGVLAAIQLQHVWVEADVSFFPGRGATAAPGTQWVAMDGAFKQHQLVAGLDLRQLASAHLGQLSGALGQAASADAQGGVANLYPEYMGQQLKLLADEVQSAIRSTVPNPTVSDVVGTAEIVPLDPPVLAAGLPYRVVTRSTATSALSAQQRHAVSVTLYASEMDRDLESPDVQFSISLPKLGSGRLGVTYVPASDADAQLLQSYRDQGAKSLPVYLIHLVPEVQVDGVTVARGSAVTMGDDQIWDLSMAGPTISGAQADSYDVVAGSEVVFGLDGDGITREVIQKRMATTPSDTAAEGLHEAALHYWWENDELQAITARARGVQALRLPSAGLFSSPLSVSYLFGMPHTGTYASRMMDVKRLVIAAVAPGDQERFNYVSDVGMMGSYLEGSVFDQLFKRFQGVGVSTAEILLEAASKQIPIYTLTASNVDQLLPGIQAPDDVRQSIRSAIGAGKRVIIPARSPRSTVGYLVQDPQTGEGAYLISAGLSGGAQQNCDDEGEPLAELVRDVLLAIALAALLIALAAIVAESLGTLGPAVVPVLRMILMGAGSSTLLFAGNAYAGEPNPCCKVTPVPHRGGDPVHDLCADEIGPNDYPGCDAQMDGSNFDAITDGQVLWEVKTYNLANCTTDFCRNTLLNMWITSTNAQLAAYKAKANSCGHVLAFGVGDPEFGDRIDPLTYDVKVESSVCLQP